ncbi:MAG: TonB family protein [Aliarcobacter sp.]|nr:TonB family protein [Aliarcobacter sp.]
MNKFIISLCFISVLSLHIVLFLYYRNTQIISSKPIQNSTVLLQLSKATQIEEINKPIVQEKKELVKKEIAKEPIKKEKVINKPIIKESNEEVHIVEKNIEIQQNQVVTNEPSKKTEQKIEKVLPQINNQEQEYIDKYASKLRDEINKNKTYPTISKKLKEEGRVVISFRVLKSGQFTNIKILISSNKERLDKAALNALYDTKEYESFDQSINKEFLDFELPLEFKLN